MSLPYRCVDWILSEEEELLEQLEILHHEKH